MVDQWAILVIIGFMRISSVGAVFMPMENSIPEPLITLRNALLASNMANQPINYNNLEYNMWKFGMEKLKHYCDSGRSPEVYTRPCEIVSGIYNSKFANYHYSHADINQMNRYLDKIARTAPNYEAVSQKLQNSIVYIGWYEMKQFCNDRNNDWATSTYNSVTCTLVRSTVKRGSDWNLAQSAPSAESNTGR